MKERGTAQVPQQLTVEASCLCGGGWGQREQKAGVPPGRVLTSFSSTVQTWGAHSELTEYSFSSLPEILHISSRVTGVTCGQPDTKDRVSLSVPPLQRPGFILQVTLSSFTVCVLQGQGKTTLQIKTNNLLSVFKHSVYLKHHSQKKLLEKYLSLGDGTLLCRQAVAARSVLGSSGTGDRPVPGQLRQLLHGAK